MAIHQLNPELEDILGPCSGYIKLELEFAYPFSSHEDVMEILNRFNATPTEISYNTDTFSMHTLGSGKQIVPSQSCCELRAMALEQDPNIIFGSKSIKFEPKKEKLTDEEIIQRYHQIMEERNNEPKAELEPELDYDHIDI